MSIGTTYAHHTNVCLRCLLKSNAISRLAEVHGESKRCDLCNRKRTPTISSTHIRPLFAKLAPLYHPVIHGSAEPPWHTGRYPQPERWAGWGLWDLLDQHWLIFHPSVSTKKRVQLLDSTWPGGVRTGFELRDDLDYYKSPEWKRFVNKLSKGHRFFFSNQSDAFVRRLSHLKTMREAFSAKLDTKQWFRARVGGLGDRPFRPRQMIAPPPKLAIAGRANSAGVQVLYAASSPDTAIAEVRAEPGDQVSIATIEVRGNLQLLRLEAATPRVSPFDVDNCVQSIRTQSFLRHIGRALSRPLRRTDAPVDYLPTQYIADYCRQIGFDGITFQSSVADGINLVLFNQKHCEIADVNYVEVIRKRVEWEPFDPWRSASF